MKLSQNNPKSQMQTPLTLANEAKCWLCRNKSNDEAKKLHTFMIQNISTIGVDAMTDMIHSHLGEIAGPDTTGAGRGDVREHINGSHILTPSLQIAHILRSLIALKDTLHSMLLTEGEDGCKCVDTKNVTAYLRVVSEIMQVYSTGEVSKMLFSTEDKHSL